MALSAVAKGKKRALIVEDEEESSASPVEAPVKRSKSRAETRPCPICKEKIPLRLLGKHAALEAERIDNIIQQIGSDQPIRDQYEEEPGPHARSRLSALKAQKSIAPRTAKADALDPTAKTIRAIKRNRKQRHAKLKEMLGEDEDDDWRKGLVGGQMDCPICSQNVRGDQGVLEAHVDACVTNEELRLAEQAQQEALQRQYDEEARWEESNSNYVGDLRGAGFHTRNRQTEDVDDEIDIDGDDATFGAPQFTEGDVVHLEDREQDTDEDADVDIDIEDEGSGVGAIAARRQHSRRGGTSTPRTTTPHENPARLQVASMAAKKQADRVELMTTLEQTLTTAQESPLSPSSASPVCRICLDPYEEPTVSTGCWHTCCRQCWLRCLGSAKLCPICKRITIPSDLRLIYM